MKIFADGAVLDDMLKLYKENKLIKGFTTNPSLMKKAGVKSYTQFAKSVLENIKDLPISFEVFADDFDQMEKEALEISSWADNVYVKIPITNSKGDSSIPLIKKLVDKNVKVNITAILTLEQVSESVNALNENVPSIISVFAGRIADSGRDPVYYMTEAKKLCQKKKNIELLWASPREVYNIIQCEKVGADIITCTKEIIDKYMKKGKDLNEISLDTVKMFANDIKDLGYSIL